MNITFNVNSDDDELVIVKAYSGFPTDATILGNRLAPQMQHSRKIDMDDAIKLPYASSFLFKIPVMIIAIKATTGKIKRNGAYL